MFQLKPVTKAPWSAFLTVLPVLHGLEDAMQGEMIEFPGNTYGLALNLERDSVGTVILGEYEHITEGDTVKCTGRILEVPHGPGLLGRVVNALGEPIDGRVRLRMMVSHRLKRLRRVLSGVNQLISRYRPA